MHLLVMNANCLRTKGQSLLYRIGGRIAKGGTDLQSSAHLLDPRQGAEMKRGKDNLVGHAIGHHHAHNQPDQGCRVLLAHKAESSYLAPHPTPLAATESDVLGQRHLGYVSTAIGGAVNRLIMDDHQMSVPTEMHIGLHIFTAKFDGILEPG